MKDITNCVTNYKNRIELFLSQLNIEKKYFDISLERVMKWKPIMIAEVQQEIVAAVGLEKKFGIMRSVIILRKEVQGKGLGQSYLHALLGKARETCHIVWAIIAEGNSASMKLHLAADYRVIGKRQNLFYLAVPLDCFGDALLWSFKLIFPLTKVVDRIRQ